MITGEVETTGQWPNNSVPIKTYPEHLERDISNIIGLSTAKKIDKDGDYFWVIQDLSALTIELMEYILNETKRI